MAKTVVALYRDLNQAQRAVSDLLSEGIEQNRISLIRRDGMANQDPAGTSAAANTRGGDYRPDASSHEGKLDAGSGAVIGGATGAVIGGAAGAFLAGVANIAIPGLGVLLGIGPLAATILGGAGIGAVTGGIAGALVNSGVSEEHASYYERGVQQGGTLVTVHADDDEAEQVADILGRFDPLDVDNKEEIGSSWASSSRETTTGTSTTGLAGTGVGPGLATSGSMDRDDVTSAGTRDVAAPAVASGGNLGSGREIRSDADEAIEDQDITTRRTAAAASADASRVLPEVEEQLDVTKREVSAGRARVRTRVYERPVDATVHLREEKVNVERRAVDRPLRPGEDAFREDIIEVTETREEPVVRKEARVVGEVIVDKTATERDENVHDTVRRTQVEVERDANNVDAMEGNRSGQRNVLGSEGNSK